MIVPKYILHCPFTPTLGPATQSWALSIHPSPSYPSQTFHPHSMPSRSVPVPLHSLKALHTHPNPCPHIFMPSIHVKATIPIPDPPHTPKAPYTHRRSSTPNQSPHTNLRAFHTYPWPPHYSLVLYIQPRLSNPVPGYQNLNPEMVITVNFRNMLNGAQRVKLGWLLSKQPSAFSIDQQPTDVCGCMCECGWDR